MCIFGLPLWLSGNTVQETQEIQIQSWVGRIPWRRAWQPTPVFLPGDSRGQRSLVGYSPWDHKELDMTEATEQEHDFPYTHMFRLSLLTLL